MYTPWAAFSLDRSRKSGLLVPDLGVSSEVGYFIHQPYYFAVDPEYDVTVHAGWFSDRGFPLGLEVRATPDVRSQGVMRMDWLRDEEIAPTEADEQDRFRGDGLVRSNRQRYWLRGKYDGRLTDPSWRIKADVDIVSDQNYLREFTTPTMSFDESDDLLTDRFGRGLDTKDDSIRTNEMLVTRDWENAGIGLGAQYNQNLAFFTDNNSLDEDPTVQRLPELTAHWFKSELGATGLELLADAQLA
jgi:LPS-assembly protein